jgi:ribose 5-phosphate isomerase RpiB
MKIAMGADHAGFALNQQIGDARAAARQDSKIGTPK